MNINASNQRVASTGFLTINGNNITNIDIGLVQVQTFDLAFSKTISKVTIVNDNKTRELEYDNTNLAKVEIKAKELNGTKVIIEYTIKITNQGEAVGYVRNIVDYKTADLAFDAALNSDWYESGGYLYCDSLSNVPIEAGETKEVKLILTKTMTEANTGLVNNIAEIAEDYNLYGITDSDSTPGNKENGEDDMGSADIIISVSTGRVVKSIILIISIIMITILTAYFIKKKIRNIR